MMDNLLVYVLLLSGIAIGWLLGYRFAKGGKKAKAPDWIPSVEFLLAEALARPAIGEELAPRRAVCL